MERSDDCRLPLSAGSDSALRRWVKIARRKDFEKYAYKSKDGEVDPAYLIAGAGKKFEFRLGNALREFLSVDREDKPMRFDYKVNDLEQARAKLTRIMVGRLAIARAMIEAKTPEELKQRLQEMSKCFEKIRVWSYDEPKEKGAGD